MAEEGRALFEYSRRGKLEDVQEELANGESPNSYFCYDGSTPLMAASRSGHAEVVQVLLQARADLLARSEDGSDALLHAAGGGSAAVIRVLLGARADPGTVNEEEVSPLILAAHYSHGGAVLALLEARADPNDSAPGWGSPLDSAKGECVALLLQHGAQRQGDVTKPASVRAGEHFTYNCLDDDPAQAEAALQQFTERARDPGERPSASGICRRRAGSQGPSGCGIV